ncbi:LysR family transcriptional regulator [Bogoriella caseilytica]|uniref:DNA-binding transcriptional LysR family regulator n=1 Tax=Bogoriella caseilytica TaxID=56055 RepID=A0A3N2BEP7_9MICO|nr:LysR family transcriptional regulator [Bogoriella caseilytica]ROR73730.1 DNA-binding transcriptional LysR family regulator [Bogoriella caseilytica]
MDIDPRRLAFLLAVSRSGGVLAAAEALAVSPSAVSQQIARLELETGVKVLDRQPAGAILTPAGRVLAETAERIENDLGDARRSLAELEGDVSGVVTVGAFQTVIRAVLVPLLAELDQTLPGIELVVHEVGSEAGLRGLRRGELDLLVTDHDVSPPDSPPAGVKDVPFLDEPWVVALPAGDAAPTVLEDFAERTWIFPEHRGATADALARLTREVPLRGKARHTYHDFDVALSMVEAGLGIALLPALAVRRILPAGVQWAALPGLGQRRLVVSHRVTRTEPRVATSAVLEQMIAVAAALGPLTPVRVTA